MKMDNYRRNLDVMAEPSDPKERPKANFVEFSDWTALYLAQVLDEYGHYEAETEREESIAKGYAEYIRDRVRSYDGRAMHVKVYFHDSVGTDVFLEALDYFPSSGRIDVEPNIIDSVYDYVAESALDWGFSIPLEVEDGA